MKSMPNINTLPLYSMRLPVLGIDVEYVPFNVNQEKALITALESEVSDDVVRNYENILKSCIQTEIDWARLSVIDYIVMVINVRSKSKGEHVQLRKKACESCGNPFEFSVDVCESLVFSNEDSKKKVITMTDLLSLELSPMKYSFLYGLDGVKDEMDLYMHTAAHCVSKVIWGKDIFTPGPDEIKEKLLSNMTKGNLETIFKEYGDLITVHIEITYECPGCGHKETKVVKDFLKSLT